MDSRVLESYMTGPHVIYMYLTILPKGWPHGTSTAIDRSGSKCAVIGKEYSNAAYPHRSSGRQGILLCYEKIKYRDDHAEGMKSSIRGRVAIFPYGNNLIFGGSHHLQVFTTIAKL